MAKRSNPSSPLRGPDGRFRRNDETTPDTSKTPGIASWPAAGMTVCIGGTAAFTLPRLGLPIPTLPELPSLEISYARSTTWVMGGTEETDTKDTDTLQGRFANLDYDK